MKLHKINKLKKNKEKTRKKRKFENLKIWRVQVCMCVYQTITMTRKKKTKEGVLAFNFIRELNKGGER